MDLNSETTFIIWVRYFANPSEILPLLENYFLSHCWLFPRVCAVVFIRILRLFGELYCTSLIAFSVAMNLFVSLSKSIAELLVSFHFGISVAFFARFSS